MARKRVTAADYVERHDREMRGILGELLENASKANLNWTYTRDYVRGNPDRALDELVAAEIALKTFIRIELSAALRVIDRASDLLDQELPDDDDSMSPRE